MGLNGRVAVAVLSGEDQGRGRGQILRCASAFEDVQRQARRHDKERSELRQQWLG